MDGNTYVLDDSRMVAQLEALNEKAETLEIVATEYVETLQIVREDLESCTVSIWVLCGVLVGAAVGIVISRMWEG